ncbi:putative serine/threonine-protein kinase vps15 [Dorcoceras hygrometricum]|uniref:Putative serine/threonine-protein kinase vps15 n=1 Tax=Dorcoceras hygrometricum TaxID=472368 RepID=A0A2Z6ZU18_9LAMI|nr:putative serine/threonine-protein kinase vps15 [Dorcoceras hygrometricum]
MDIFMLRAGRATGARQTGDVASGWPDERAHAGRAPTARSGRLVASLDAARYCWLRKTLHCGREKMRDVEPPLRATLADRCATLRRAGCAQARWPRDVARDIVRRRAIFFVWRPPAGRRSGDAPAIS